MKAIVCIALALIPLHLIGQQVVEVTERTLKIGANSEEVMYFGFAEGDQIVVDFEEVNGKELKEVEVIEYPSSSKYMEYKIVKVQDKRIRVPRKGVYKFRFFNGHAVAGRICKVKLGRIPISETTVDFNSSVTWSTRQDTSWNTYTKDVVVGYDTLKIPKTRKVIFKCDTLEEFIMDKVQRVHSITNENGNKTSVFFTLPQNKVLPYEERKVVAWAYWVGVGEEANAAWQKNVKAMGGFAKGVASMTLTPLGALAVGFVTDLMVPTLGEDVSYGIVDATNKDYWYQGYEYRGYDFGKGIAGFKRFTERGLMQGTYYVIMSNDNYLQGVDAYVKVSAIVEQKTYRDEAYTDLKVTPRYEKQLMRDPIIKTYEEPIIGN